LGVFETIGVIVRNYFTSIVYDCVKYCPSGTTKNALQSF